MKVGPSEKIYNLGCRVEDERFAGFGLGPGPNSGSGGWAFMPRAAQHMGPGHKAIALLVTR